MTLIKKHEARKLALRKKGLAKVLESLKPILVDDAKQEIDYEVNGFFGVFVKPNEENIQKIYKRLPFIANAGIFTRFTDLDGNDYAYNVVESGEGNTLREAYESLLNKLNHGGK